MTLCLYECLRAVGLQCHYARFTSVGVRRVAHLSGLTMEDYHNLGVRSMEDRTRLFHLVQMVKTLDLESLEYEDRDDDDDNDYDHGDEGYAIADCSITYDGCGEPDEDEYNDVDEKGDAVSSFSKPSRVRRRLDFSCESSDHHQKRLPLPVGTVHVYTSHNRNNESGQSKGSAISVQLELDTESPVVCSCKGNNNHRSDVHSHQSDHRTGANSKPDIVEGISINNSHTRLSPKCVSSHRPKPRPATVASNSFSNKLNGYKDRKGISRKENLYAEISRNAASEHTTKATPVYESKRTAGYNYGLPLSSPPSPNKKQPDGQRISVCVRKRPLTQGECRRGEADVVTTPSGECVTVHESKEAVDLTQYILQHRFYFDQVFGEESSNEEVYRKTAYPLVQHMLNGGKATCFAYGQTGAGKTHTMLGSSPGRPGLYALAVRDIFAQLSTTRKHSPLLVYVSFFEIYCGQLYDLLDHRKRLFAREDGQKVVHIARLRHVRVDSVSSLLEVISHGTEERTQGMSGVNPLSSRSHALLQIQLRGSNQQIAGRMWFVDLAGSERASDTKEPDRQSRMEGAEINQSLLALKECIRSLDQEQLHTPFRQSKLTQVLKDSFIGDSMTCMIANISPGHLATEHTLNTLRYADRVKELRGQGGLRGGRRGKTIPSPKCNLSNGNSSRGGSSVGTRGKSPPKKPKLGRQKEAFSPTTPTPRLATEGAVLCSTPKKDRWGEETGAIAKNGFGIEQITPIRGSLGTGDKRERADGRITRKREKYGGTESEGDQNVRARPGEQLHLWEVPRESGFYHRERENQQSKGGKVDERAIRGLEAERRWTEQRRQVESSTDTCSDVERLRERDLQKVKSVNERVRHLRQYHQQLQQFMPSSASSSDHLFSPSACQSFSSSNQASLSPSSSSSLQHSSSISVSALMCHGLEDVLDAHGVARVEVRTGGFRGQSSSSSSGEICLQTGTSPSYNKNNDEVDHGDSGGVSEDWRVSQEGTEAGFGHDRGKREKRRSQKARGQGEVRVKREDWRSAKMEGGGERRWAWMPTTGTDRVTGARPADVEASVSGNCDSDMGEEGLEASNVPSDRLWSTEEQEEADGYDLVPTHSNNNSNSLFNHPLVESTHQRAPAERPLSPPCEHTNTLLTPNKLSEHTRRTSNILPLPLRNVQQGVPSSSRKEKESWFATNANRREYFSSQSTTLPLSTPIVQNGRKIPAEPLNVLSENPAHTHSHPQVNAKTSVLAQEDTSTDSLSYIMDPLSISLLDVDRQVATASFLQGEQNTSLCVLEYEKEEDKRGDAEKEHLTCAKMANKNVESEDTEFRLSLLELPQAETRYSPMSETMAATNSEPRKDLCFATYEHCGIGTMKTAISEVMLASLQDHDNNQKLQTTPDIEVLDNKGSASVQHPERTGSPSSHNLPPEYAHNVPNSLAFSISTPQSESVPGQLNKLPKHCHTVHSNQCKNSNIALQPTVPTDLKSEEGTSKMQIRPIIHLSMLEDLYHDQWRVVQAHWEQLEEMESLCRKEGTLLCQQPDMAFGEYVHKLGEIMERKARCVHSMIAQLQPYLKTSHINKPHNQAEDNHDQIT